MQAWSECWCVVGLTHYTYAPPPPNGQCSRWSIIWQIDISWHVSSLELHLYKQLTRNLTSRLLKIQRNPGVCRRFLASVKPHALHRKYKQRSPTHAGCNLLALLQCKSRKSWHCMYFSTLRIYHLVWQLYQVASFAYNWSLLWACKPNDILTT